MFSFDFLLRVVIPGAISFPSSKGVCSADRVFNDNTITDGILYHSFNHNDNHTSFVKKTDIWFHITSTLLHSYNRKHDTKTSEISFSKRKYFNRTRQCFFPGMIKTSKFYTVTFN